MTTSSVPGTSAWSSILANSSVPTTGTAASATTSTSASSASTSQSLQQTFLQLLVAQMNNQDPLNPVDNSQLTTQMAQISTVGGINSLNTTVSGLVAQLQQSATIQSAQLTGHTAMVAGSSLDLGTNSSSSAAGGTGVSAVGGFSLGSGANSVTVTITDASGATVKTLQLGAKGAGMQDFSWDGSTNAGTTAAAGTYNFAVQASYNGSPVAATTYSLQAIVGAVPQADGTTQLMLGNGTQVPFSAVQQII
jgi:flagellar basal-body rod modification protein FlgD